MLNINDVLLDSFESAKLLNSGFYGSVYAHNEHTVLKTIKAESFDMQQLELWTQADGSLMPAEILAMKWANNVNGLVCGYKDHFEVEDIGYIIALERLYPMHPTAFSAEEIAVAVEVAEEQLKELHSSGWAHGDIMRPYVVQIMSRNNPHEIFNNVLLTKQDNNCVLRLVDTGFSLVEQYLEDVFDDVGNVIFDSSIELEECIQKDLEDWYAFKEWILNYPRSLE